MTREEKRDKKMNKLKKQGKFKKVNLFTGILLGMYLTVSAYLVYNLYMLHGIENLIRYSAMIVFGLFGFYLILKYLKMRRKPLRRKYVIFIIILLLLGSVEYFVAYTINKGLNVVESISVKKYKTYSTSLISLKSGKLQNIKDIDSETKIGRITDKEDIEGYVLTKDLMKKDSIGDSQISDYEDSITMLYDLYDGKVDCVFISSSYAEIYDTMDKFENIKDEVIELDKFSKKMRIKESKETISSTKSITEPFTVLLMGVDSTEEDLTKTNGLGDSLMLVTFNPNTLNATILSIPRDTFVPITCYGNKLSKITHAASGGDKCMIGTIENAFDVDIDYYVKVNFFGLQKIVDALGGIDVDVPYTFCETTMWRTEEFMVYVDEGMQHLNGEQALALSRNRKTYKRCGAKYNKGERNDFVRGQNQQLVIDAIIDKAKNMTSINQFYNLLDAVGNSMTTNMDRKQILSFYNVFKNVIINSKDLQEENKILNMQKMYLNGSGGLIYDNIMGMNLYEFVPSNQSLNAIIDAMHVNLGLKEETVAKTFSFSADEEYVPKVIGKDLYGGVTKYETKEETVENSCGTDEEYGADGVTCVCKHGYERDSNGVCKKQEVKCPYNKELGGDGVTCVCKPDYLSSDNVTCLTKPEGSENNDDNQEPVDPDPSPTDPDPSPTDPDPNIPPDPNEGDNGA